MGWAVGDVIVERQIWHGTLQLAIPTIVVEASESQVVTYTAPGAPFWFPEERVYPGPEGRHPWYGRNAWQGHGKLVVTPRIGDHSVIHLWEGDARRFECWYLNIEEPMRPTEIGFDTQDLELDVVVRPDRTWTLKDDEALDERVREGRWTAEEAIAIRAVGQRIVDEVLVPRRWWWDEAWATWTPPPGLPRPAFPRGWLDVPPTAP